MAGLIPDDTLQAIRERVSIVEIVSGYVTLKKAGRNYLGLCPFHGEKTPSFTVSDERGLFHCFGCGAGGTVFTFLMRADHIGFPEAVEALARRAGVALPTRAAAGDSQHRQELIEINEAAQRYFAESLRASAGTAARQYLAKRGVSSATIERYGLGFCPAAGAGLARALAGRRVPPPKAIELGLIGRRQDGSVYDRFWGRVTFPIRDGSGHIRGFGARTLGTEHPKYLNSPESPLFHKGHVLYGLFEAREAIRSADRVVIVEGYLDALALVEAGIGNAVASLGTALTAAQLRLAKRFAPEVVAFFDGDRAGQAAAVRAFGVCVEAGVWGLGAFLPEGFVPDTYVRQQGATATMTLLRDAIPLADYFIDKLDPGPTASLPQRASAAEKIGQVIAGLRDQNPFQFDLLARKSAQRLGVSESVFRTLRPLGAAREPERTSDPPISTAEPYRKEEATLIEVMVLDRDASRLVEDSRVLDAFSNAVLAEAGRAVLAALTRNADPAAALDRFPAALVQQISAGLLGQGPVAGGDRLQVARDCIARIEQRRTAQEKRRQLSKLRQAEAAGDDTAARQQLETLRTVGVPGGRT